MKRELEFHAGQLPGHADPDQEAERLPINYFDLIRRNRLWLGCGLVAGVIFGHLAYLKMGPEYEATAQIMVTRRNSVPIKEEQRTLTSWGERTEHIALIQSPIIASKAVEIGHLQDLPTFRNSDDLVEDVLDGLLVKRSAGQDRSIINVLNLTYSSKQAHDACAVVDSVIAAYADYLEETRYEQSNEVLALAQKAHDDIQQQLRQKEQDYLDFRDKAPLQWRSPVGATPDGQATTTNIHQERVLAIEEQRRLTLLRKAELQSRIDSINQAIDSGESRDALEVLVRRFITADGPTGGDQQRQQEIAAFENKLLPLLLQEQQLAQDYGDDHPELAAVRKSIKTTVEFYRQHGLRMPNDIDPNDQKARKQDPDIVALYVESLNPQLSELDLRDKVLANLSEMEQAKAKELARYQAEDQSRNAEISRIRELWEQLVAQVAQVSIEKESSGYSLKKLAPVKSLISIKRLLKFYSGGAIFGLGLIAVWAFVREWRDTTLKRAKDLQLCLRHPIFGGVREFRVTADQWGPFSGKPHPALRYLHAPLSIEAEHIRSIRSALSVAIDNRRAKIIQITSPEPGDGKTTMIANLAIAEAQAGRRVLLIDADLRRPCVHTLFRVSQGRGLAEALSGTLTVQDVLGESGIPGLKLLNAGTPPANPAELLSSSRWQRVLHELRPDFDLIFVDSPPLLAVSDPCEIARHVDGLVLVVRMGKNTRTAVIRARDLIVSHNLPMLGVVANGLVSEDSTEDGYYKEYVSPAVAQQNERKTNPSELVSVSS